MSSSVAFGLLAALTLVGFCARVREFRRFQTSRTVIREIRRADSPLLCIYSGGLRFQDRVIGGYRTAWQPYVIAVLPGQIAFYLVVPGGDPYLTFGPDELRWFGRPKRYSYFRNTLWLHIEREGRWHLVKLRLHRAQMQALIRALKQVAAPEQVTAYRRLRPYIHAGPVSARPAAQDMFGAWTLGEPLDLYLMPLFLVVLQDGTVQRTIPLAAAQRIGAIRRLDQRGAQGLVRFEARGEAFAFALVRYEAFATALADAAKRTLEDAVQWQRKKKKSDQGIEEQD